MRMNFKLLSIPMALILLTAATAAAAGQDNPLAAAAERLAAGQAAEALALLQPVLDANPQDRDGLELLGQVHEAMGQPDEAVAAYQLAIAADPEYGPAYLRLGLLYLNQDRVAVALSPLESAARLLPDVPLAQVLAGVALRENGRLAEAVAAFDRALALDSSNPNLWLDAAVTRQAAGDPTGAAEAAEEAFALAPQRVDVAVARARFLSNSEALEVRMRAPAAYRHALTLNSDRRMMWNELAEVYSGLGMYAEAAAAHREVLAIDDSNPIEHMELAFTLARQELWEEAAGEYTRALELDAEQGWAYYYRSEALINLDRQPEALADLEAAITRLPDQIVPLLAAIRLHSERGQHETADRYLQQAVQLQPQNAEVGLAQARSLMRQQRPEEALPILEALVANVPQMLDARYQLGQALMRVGRTDEGRQVLADYQQLLQQQTTAQQTATRDQVEGRTQVHLIRGTVYLQEGRLEEAREQLEAAAEMAPDDTEVLATLLRCLEAIGDEAAAAEVRARLDAAR